MTFSGSYKFKSMANINKLDIAFLYSKLQDEDRDFVFTGGTTSWRRLNPPYVDNTTEVRICVEIPEPTGVFASEDDAKNNRRKPNVDTGLEPPPVPSSRVGTLFYIVRDTGVEPRFLNIFKIEGLSTFPSAEQISVDGNYYGFWEDDPNFPGVLLGIAPTHNPLNCPLLKSQTIPIGLIRIGFSLPKAPLWKKENFYYFAPTSAILSRETFYQEEYGSFPIIGVDWQNTENHSFSCHSRLRVFLQESLIDPALSGCGSVVNSDSWYLAQPHKWQSFFPGPPGVTEPNKIGFFAVEIDMDQRGAVEAFLTQVLSYWGIPGTLQFVRGVKSGGCNIDEEGNIYPPSPPDPAKPVYSSRFKGRYSEIFLNYQSKGEVKELKLPIEFPTRATKIKLIPSAPVEHYHPDIPIEGEWRATEQPLVSEAFVGRVDIDKDNIYASILYGTIREWESGKSLPDDPDDARNFNGQIWFTERLYNPFIGDDFLEYGDGSSNNSLAKPVKDSWKFCRTFVINKETFTITSDTIRTYPDSLTNINHFIIDYTILQQQKTPVYNNYYSQLSGYGQVSIAQLTASDNAFTGNPVCYPQIAGTIRGEWDINSNLDPYFPIGTIPDYLKPQTLWTQQDWIFWNLLEKPKKPLANTSYFRFEIENKFGGHGRSSVNPTRFFIDLEGRSSVNAHQFSGTSANYFSEIVESERFRGSPILDSQGKVIKWLRVSPYSYPYFEPGINQADTEEPNQIP